MFEIQNISKAIAGGLVSLIVAEATKYWFTPSAEQVSALSVIVVGLVSYAVGHLFVYLAPRNK